MISKRRSTEQHGRHLIRLSIIERRGKQKKEGNTLQKGRGDHHHVLEAGEEDVRGLHLGGRRRVEIQAHQLAKVIDIIEIKSLNAK